METYDLSDGDWGAIYAIGTTAAGLTMIAIGGLADHYRARNLVTWLLAIMAVFCLAMAFNTSVWLLPFVIFGLRLTGQGMLSHTAMVAMSRWYSATRGKAVAISSLGFTFGEAILPITVVTLFAFISWQSIWIIAAVLSICFIFLLRYLLVAERTPQSISKTTQAVGMNGFHWTRHQAIRHPLLWIMIPFAMTPGTFSTALFFQQVHLAEVKGWNHSLFVSLIPIYSITIVTATLISGWAIDRWGSKSLLPYMLIPLAISLCIFSISDSIFAIVLGFIFLGLMQGSIGTASVSFWSDTYGTKHVGSIKSLMTACMVFGSAIGPALTGGLIDLGINFPNQMLYYSVFVLCVSALTFYGIQRFLRK